MADERALLEQAYEDFDVGDVAAVLAVLDDDVQWFQAEGNPWWQGAPAIGPQHVLEQVARVRDIPDGEVARQQYVEHLQQVLDVDAQVAAGTR